MLFISLDYPYPWLSLWFPCYLLVKMIMWKHLSNLPAIKLCSFSLILLRHPSNHFLIVILATSSSIIYSSSSLSLHWKPFHIWKNRYCNYFFTLCTIYLAVEICLRHNVYLAKSSSSCRAFLMLTDLHESMDRTSWKLKGTKVWPLKQNLPLQTSFNHG